MGMAIETMPYFRVAHTQLHSKDPAQSRPGKAVTGVDIRRRRLG